MRIIKRIQTAAQRINEEWRAQDEPTRRVLREIGRLGYDPNPTRQESDGVEPGRVYFTGVGAKRLTVVVRVEPETSKILRVVVGKKSFTARQAGPWLAKRAPREKRYL